MHPSPGSGIGGHGVLELLETQQWLYWKLGAFPDLARAGWRSPPLVSLAVPLENVATLEGGLWHCSPLKALPSANSNFLKIHPQKNSRYFSPWQP